MEISLDNSHIDGVNGILLITRMYKELKTEILNTLKKIRGLEININNARSKMGRNVLIKERQYNIHDLEKTYNKNELNYKVFYERLKRKEN